MRFHRYRAGLGAALLSSAVASAPAFADTVAFQSSPLDVHVGERGQLQALRVDRADRSDDPGIFYPPTSPSGDAGFFLAFTGSIPAELAGTVYGFTGGAGPALPTEFTPLTQGPVTGDGTGTLAQVTTYAVRPDATDLVTIVQTTRYVNGAQQFAIRWDVLNSSGAPLEFKALAAADFFFDGSDRGTGIFTEGPPRFVGGTNADTGNSGGFVEVLGVPSISPPWSAYQALAFGGAEDQIWGKVQNAAAAPSSSFDDTVVGEPVDNAGGVEWDQFVAAPLADGATATFELVVRSAVPAPLIIVPSNAGAPKGVPINFTATATNTSGVPYAGRTLRYDILGANLVSGAVTLDPTGSATITDPGTNAGDDTVVAYVDFNSNGEREFVEPQASALATFVDDVPPACSVKVSGDRPGGGGAGKPLVITVSCNETATVTTSTRLQTGRTPGVAPRDAFVVLAARRRPKIIQLEPTSATVAPGETVPVDVIIPTSVARKYSGRKLEATVTIIATDAAGNVTQVTATRTIKLAKFKRQHRKSQAAR